MQRSEQGPLRDGGERRALVPEGASTPRQPGATRVHRGRRHRALRLHFGPLVRGILQRGDQPVEVSEWGEGDEDTIRFIKSVISGSRFRRLCACALANAGGYTTPMRVTRNARG